MCVYVCVCVATQQCKVSADCARAGLHCHHPRDCLYHLRDNSISNLQALLQDHHVVYDREPQSDDGGGGGGQENTCGVMEQKETAQGLEDEACGRKVDKHQAGLCE